MSYFVHASNFHQLPPRSSAIAIIPYFVNVLYLIATYTWFAICCSLVGPRRGETLQQYLDRLWMPQHFVTYYLLPLISSVTTCPHNLLLAFPASDIINYKRRTHGAPHYTVSEGVGAVQDRLIKGIDVALTATVTTVEPFEKGVRLSWTQDGASETKTQTEYFDRVVLAVAPDVVGHVFKPLQHYMHRIPTTIVESVVHTDSSVLCGSDAAKANRQDAQLIHLHTSPKSTHMTESHHLQPCGAVVTTCPFSPLQAPFVAHQAKFTRVLRSPESQRIVNTIFEHGSRSCADDKTMPLWRNGDDNVWLVGGWCWDGMVLLEGCVVSAMRVADAFGVEVPWRHQ
jgi:predicted NAD/FAD-binding protein